MPASRSSGWVPAATVTIIVSLWASDKRDQNMDDITKRPAYVWIDLIARVISAVAVVTLGIAGWRLQKADQETRLLDDQRKRLEDHNELVARRYLPMLRSMTELEVALDRCAVGLRASTGDTIFSRPEVTGESMRHAAEMLRHIGQAVFVPDGDPEIEVRPSRGSALPRVKLPLRSATLMLSDMMRIKTYMATTPLACRPCNIRKVGATITIESPDNDDFPVTFYLTPGSIPAWEAWISSVHSQLGDPIRVDEVLPNLMVQLIHDLEFGAADVMHKTVMNHVEIADRYVSVRNDVFANWQNPIFDFERTAPTTALKPGSAELRN